LRDSLFVPNSQTKQTLKPLAQILKTIQRKIDKQIFAKKDSK